MTLQVVQIERLNPLIKSFVLNRSDGAALPPWTAGAHVQVKVGLPSPGVPDQWRHYSLLDLDGASDRPEAPTHYRIAVRIEDAGRGGSQFMHHQVQQGTPLQVRAPANDFPLAPTTGRSVLIAGGIGITPLLSMAAALRGAGAPYALHYSGRSRALMAFLPQLQAGHGTRLAVHADDEAGRTLDIDALLAGCALDDQLYVCGPAAMLDAMLARAEARGWPRERLHFELFAAAAAHAGDGSFELVLAGSGRSLTVPADRTILEVLIDSGCDPLYDCQRGECGVCTTRVIEGEIDHRDHILSARERAAGDVIQTCVSRCKGTRLVLDL
jgi:vanillate O-demethylase ferredoxin subunit